MGVCCFLVIVVIVVLVIKKIMELEQHEADVRNYQINTLVGNINKELEFIDSKLKSFFRNDEFIPYKNVCAELESSVSKLYGLNTNLLSYKKHNYNFKKSIVDREKLILKFRKFEDQLDTYSWSNIYNSEKYGSVNTEYLDSIKSLNRNELDEWIKTWDGAFERNDINQILNVDYELLVKCIWFYAITKPYSAEHYKKAVTMFKKGFKWSYIDLTITELYTLKQVGGEDLLQNEVRKLIKKFEGHHEEYDTFALTAVASFLMWMQAYQSECVILQHMLSQKMQMTAFMQERLHSLLNGINDAPVSMDIQSEGEEIYFDISSLAWKDKELNGFFENLAFQDKVLNYSLAIRSEDKALYIPKELTVPSLENIVEKVKELFEEEYGDVASAKNMLSVALSNGNEEKMDCILCNSEECPQLGVLLNAVKIGKKLNIKFYTLFMPQETDLQTQRQQALAMKNQLSPVVTMWEKSLSETVLIAVQQLFNMGNLDVKPMESEPEDSEIKF